MSQNLNRAITYLLLFIIYYIIYLTDSDPPWHEATGDKDTSNHPDNATFRGDPLCPIHYHDTGLLHHQFVCCIGEYETYITWSFSRDPETSRSSVRRPIPRRGNTTIIAHITT